MTHLLSTVGRYHAAVLANPGLAFPQLLASWVVLFLVAYKVSERLLTPKRTLSLPILPINASYFTIEEWANRTVSTLHAVIACYGSVHWFIADKHLLRSPSDYGFLESVYCDFYLGVTLGYLLFDLLRLLYFRFIVMSKHTVTSAPVASMFIHHTVIILAYYLGVQYHYGTFYMALFLNNEITTPFLNARFLMAERGMKMHKIYALNEMAFIAGFFISRVVGNLAILYHMQIHLHHFRLLIAEKYLPTPIFYLLPVLAYSHCMLQLYWFALLVRMAYRKFMYGQRVESPTVKAPVKGSIPLAVSEAVDDVYDPPIAPNVKVTKVLGLPPTGLTGKTIKTLGCVKVANEKAAEVLGLRTTPPMPRRKRGSKVTTDSENE